MQNKYVPSTVYSANRAKISDGKSIRVAVPENTVIEAGNFYVLDGFFGAAMQSATTAAGETSEVILNIEQAEFETNQTNSSQAYEVGTPLFWNNASSKVTETASGNRFVGVVSAPKDTNGVVWFVLSPQANGRFQAASQANSAAADVATLVGDFNGLLAKLRNAGLMAQ